MDIALLNIPPSAKIDLEKFAKYTIEKWEFNLGKYKKINTGELINSFAYSITQDAGGNTAVISFTFMYYLKMIDMGTAKYVNFGEWREKKQERTSRGKYRKPYPVYSKTFYAELFKLKDLLVEQYAVIGASTVVNEFTTG